MIKNDFVEQINSDNNKTLVDNSFYSRLVKFLIPNSYFLSPKQKGFTLMELLVSISIFVTTLTVMFTLLNYTLRIHRKTEALRQSSQGIRNLVEFMSKEIRNGKIDYGTTSGTALSGDVPEPCEGTSSLGADVFGNIDGGTGDITLPLINSSGEKECIFWAQYLSNGTLWEVGNPASSANQHLAFSKAGVVDSSGNLVYERLNPENMKVDYLRFYIRPHCDPYSAGCNGGLPRRQPTVTIVMRVVVKLSTGEEVKIPYQTTISTDDYGIPSN